MKTSRRIVSLLGLLVLGTASLPFSKAQAQPVDQTMPKVPGPVDLAALPPGISALSNQDGLVLSINVKDFGGDQTLKQIVTLGNLEVVSPHEMNKPVSLNFQGTPEDAIQAFCKAEGVSCRKFEGVWIVGEMGLPDQKRLTIYFEDIEVREIIQLIAHTYNLKVDIAPDIKVKMALIRLSQITPQQALTEVAMIAHLDVAEKDGTWIISAKAPAL